MSEVNKRQVGGTHYQSEYGHWDWATDLCMRHVEGAASKYLSRAGNKAGESRAKDLEKCLHYVEKAIELTDENRLPPLHRTRAGLPVNTLTARFIAASMNGAAFTPRAVAALVILSDWSSVDELKEVERLVREELQDEERKPKIAAAPRYVEKDAAK